MAAQINKDYEGKEVHLICILKGGVFLPANNWQTPDYSGFLDFMSVSSYGSDTKSSGGKDYHDSTSRWRQECHHRGGHHRPGRTPGISDRGIKTEKSENIELCTLP